MLDWLSKLFRADPPPPVDYIEITCKIGDVFAELPYEYANFIPSSLLPCSIYTARKAFFEAYRDQYSTLSEQLRNSYHSVYCMLSRFIDDELFYRLLPIIDRLIEERRNLDIKLGITPAKDNIYKMLTLSLNPVESRENIYKRIALLDGSLNEDRILLAETCVYCSKLYAIYWDEWASYHNFVHYVLSGSGRGVHRGESR